MAFATADQLRVLLRLSVDEFVTESAQLCLDRAADAIRAEVGQHISYVDDDEVTRLPLSSGAAVLLPELPVQRLNALVQCDIDYDVDALEWDAEAGLVYPPVGCRWDPRYRVTVGYAHGWPDEQLPGFLLDVALGIAARAYVNPEQLLSEVVGATQSNYGSPLGRGLFGLTDDERRRLDQLRLERV